MATHDPTTSRRHLLTGSAALGAAGTVAAQASNPDAELIRACARHPLIVAAFNESPGTIDIEDDPLWHACCEISDFITAAKPQTLAGMQAKDRAALADGKGEPNTTGDIWAWNLVHDLLRLTGGTH